MSDLCYLRKPRIYFVILVILAVLLLVCHVFFVMSQDFIFVTKHTWTNGHSHINFQTSLEVQKNRAITLDRKRTHY